MKKRTDSETERQRVYDALLAVRASRNPKVAHVLPRKREVVLLSGLPENAVKASMHFLLKWGLMERNYRSGWIVRDIPEYFCWSHGLDSRLTRNCDICLNRTLQRRRAKLEQSQS